MPLPIAEGFSVSHAALLDPTSGADAQDIYGVREASIEVDTDSYDNTGDNAVLSTWNWVNFATLTVRGGFISFDLLQKINNTTIASTGTGSAASVSSSLWGVNSVSGPAWPVLVRIPSRGSTGESRILDVILYKVQFSPISLDGPTYRDGLVVSYTGKAVMSSVDEKGTALSEQAIGRIISRPGVA